MSIRLRTINGIRVALCGYETDEAPGDTYLDDADHYALAAKFTRDWRGQNIDPVYSAEWAVMDSQKIRNAETRDDLPRVDCRVSPSGLHEYSNGNSPRCTWCNQRQEG